MCTKEQVEQILTHLWNLPETPEWKKGAFLKSFIKFNPLAKAIKDCLK